MRGLTPAPAEGAFRPLTVTAETPAGFATGCPWAPALDGMLAFAAMQERLGRDMGTNIDLEPVEGLPLAVERHGDLWWYAAGSPETSPPLHQRDKHFHRRFNNVDAERWMAARRVETAMGPHKNLRKPHFVTTCASVSWKCVGDPGEIERLLRRIPAIGSGWSRGLGQVARWTVREGFEGELRRPVPVAWAEERGVAGPRMRHPIRPPSHLAANRVLCVMPETAPTEADSFAAADAPVRAA